MATRFYFPSTGTPDISPAFNAGWEVTTNADRRNLVTTRISSTMTDKGGVGDATTTRQLLRQYISAPLAAQTLTGSFKGQCRMNSNTANVGMGGLAVSVSKVASDGTTLTLIRAVDSSNDLGGSAPPATSGVTMTNRRMESGSNVFALTFTDVSISAGDRLIVEVGYKDQTANTGRFCNLSLGDDSGTDLPEDETTTAANNPWIEFTHDFTFASSGVSGSMSVTEALDTADIAGEVEVQGDLAVTEPQDSAAVDGQVIVQGDLDVTEPQDTASISGSNTIHGDLDATEALDTADIAGEVEVQGDLAVTEPQDVAVITALTEPIGSLEVTEPQDTAAIVGELAACEPVVLNMRNPDLDGMLASAYLDRFGRFAKRTEDIVVHRVFFASTYCPPYVDFTRAQYLALPRATRLEMDAAPSAAGLIVTEGISNA